MYLIRRQIYIIISITEQLPIIFIMEKLTWGSRILEGRENVGDTKKTPSIPTDAERLVIEIFKNFIIRI